MSIPAVPSITTEPPQAHEGAAPTTSLVKLSEPDLEELAKLPIDSLDTIRSKLVQLIDAITVFRSQLESSPLTPNTLSYPSLISKFLILLNHTEALSQALNTSIPAPPINRFELPSARAEREEHERWEYGPEKQSILGNLAAVPRGLEGLEDGKEWIIGVLTRTKLAPEIEKEEQDLLSLLPPPPPSLSSSNSTPTIESLLEHVKSLTKAHENHISNCRKALHKARYGRTSDRIDVDISSEDGGNRDNDPEYEWKMRVEVDDQSFKGTLPVEVTPNENPLLKSLLRFMRDGTTPIDQQHEFTQ